MKKKILISLIIIGSFFLSRNIKYFWGYIVFGKNEWNEMDETVATNISVYSQIVLILIVCFILFRKRLFASLGLHKEFPKAFVIGFIATLPMVIGYAIVNHLNFQISLNILHENLIVAGFFEEFLFRGFLFGILFYYAGWGFIPSVILPSIYFGIGHLYQADSISDSISIFLFTGLGSAGFAWFYTAWKNLWVVVFLHGFMDLAWAVFQIETNVVGNLWVNIFRFATLGLMVFLSLRNLKIHPENKIKGKLWVNKA